MIRFERVSKRYVRGGRAGSLRDTIPALLKRATGRGASADGGDSSAFFAVRDVSFEVRHGEALGIIGHNGAGKSTVLKLLAGVTDPTSGYIEVNGRFAALIELGAGFHPDLTGRENVYLNGSILGLTKRDIASKLESIVDFAGLEQFIDTPIKHYSSGMHARLGFSVAAHVEPEVLLIDEVLSVGDFSFQNKCLRKMEEFRASGVAIVFVSHNLNAVAALCSKAILLRSGQVMASGPPIDVINAYTSMEYTVIADTEEAGVADMEHGMVNRHVRIIGADVCSEDGASCRTFQTGSRALIKVRYRAERDVTEPILGMGLRTADGTIAYGTNTSMHKVAVHRLNAGEELLACFGVSLNLCAGRYSLNAAAVPSEGRVMFDWVENLVSFEMYGTGTGNGIADLSSTITITHPLDTDPKLPAPQRPNVRTPFSPLDTEHGP